MIPISRTRENRIALQTIINREVTRFIRIWSQSLLPPAITMTLYFIIFGNLIGSQIRSIDGYSYMAYIVPGLTMMSIITNSYANTSSSFFGTKFSKSIEEMLVSPMPNYIILLGFMFGGLLRGLMVGVIVIFISIFFTHLHIQHVGIMIAMAIFSATIFSIAGIINGILAKNFDDISFVPTFILTPLTYLGGVFYSIKQLPPFWQTLSLCNPVVAIIDTFRYGMLGVSDINIYAGFMLVGGLLVTLYCWALYLLNKGIGIRS